MIEIKQTLLLETLRLIGFIGLGLSLITWSILNFIKPELLRSFTQLTNVMIYVHIAVLTFITCSYGNLYAGVGILTVGLLSNYLMGKRK